MRVIDPNKYDSDKILRSLDYLEGCVQHDACEAKDCVYFLSQSDTQELIRFVGDVFRGLKEDRSEGKDVHSCN